MCYGPNEILILSYSKITVTYGENFWPEKAIFLSHIFGGFINLLHDA